MNDYEFIKYIPTPTENYIGIAEVFICGKFTQLFKIIPRKDGSGFFPASTSIKTKENGNDVYLHSFEIDSNKEKEALNSFIISNVKEWIERSVNSIRNADKTSNNQINYPLNKTQPTLNKQENLDFGFGGTPF